MNIRVLFFDVLGTVVDWRGSIAREVSAFLSRHDACHLDAHAFADAWVGRYDKAADAVRSGRRGFVSLDVLNMETLVDCLAEFHFPVSDQLQSELKDLNRSWHRLEPWPDAIVGLSRLKRKFIIAPLSDGSTELLVNLSKRSGLPWDTILGADIFRAYKPMPDVYRGACRLLGVAPEQAMLVAAHPYDLEGAQHCGLQTAYVVRDGASDTSKLGHYAHRDNWDYLARDLIEISDIL